MALYHIGAFGLWFDVEKRYKTMFVAGTIRDDKLWFDVEKRYKTIDMKQVIQGTPLGTRGTGPVS